MTEEKEVVTTKSDYTNTSMANVMDYMIKTIMKESINTAIPVVVTSVTRNGDVMVTGPEPVLYPLNL